MVQAFGCYGLAPGGGRSLVSGGGGNGEISGTCKVGRHDGSQKIHGIQYHPRWGGGRCT